HCLRRLRCPRHESSPRPDRRIRQEPRLPSCRRLRIRGGEGLSRRYLRCTFQAASGQPRAPREPLSSPRHTLFPPYSDRSPTPPKTVLFDRFFYPLPVRLNLREKLRTVKLC